MHVFSRHCFCKKQTIPFRSSTPYDEHAFANIFCPRCSDRAPEDALMLEVIGVPDWSGVYGVDWNRSFLEEKDVGFKNTEKYFSKLFSSGSVCFGFLPDKKSVERFLRIDGLKETSAGQTTSSKKSAADDEVVSASRKRLDRGTRAAKGRKKW